MKIETQKSERGSALMIALLICATGGVFLGSYLKLTSNSVQASARSMAWNQAMFVAETGIEEALNEINNGGTSGLASSGGWTLDVASGEYFKTNSVSTDTYYLVKVTPNSNPTITSTGYFPFSGSSTIVSRTVQVTASSSSLFAKGLVAKGQIDMKGNNISTDSFDSSDPLYSTGGKYDAAKSKDNGDVATNLDLVNSVSVGNANIKGKVSTGPGGTVSVGSNGAVGDAAWHAAGNSGVQPGYSTDDMNVSFPDVTVPFSGGFSPGSGKVGKVTYAYLLGSDNYTISSINLKSKETLYVTGDANLYVTGSFTVKGTVELAPGASLNLYVGGAADIGGNGVINPGTAENFFYYGLSTNTDIKFHGNGEFTGVIYAPSADIQMSGGGSGAEDFVGAGIFNTITMNGHYNFHYDENLASLSGGGGYTVMTWDEI